MIRDLCNDVIGHLRRFFYKINRHRKNRIFSGNIGFSVVLRKRYVYIDFFSDSCSDESVLKARDKGTGTDRQIHTFICAAVKLHAIDASHIIDIYHIAFCNLSFCYLKKFVMAAAVIIELLLNLILCHIQRANSHFQGFILTQSHIIQCLILWLFTKLLCLSSLGGCFTGSLGSCFRSIFFCCGFCLCHSFCLGLRSIRTCISGCCYTQAQQKGHDHFLFH